MYFHRWLIAGFFPPVSYGSKNWVILLCMFLLCHQVVSLIWDKSLSGRKKK